MGLVFILSTQVLRAQTAFENDFAYQSVLSKQTNLPAYHKFEYEFVNKTPETGREIDLKLGKKKTGTTRKSWIARNLGVRKISVAWRNANPLNNTYSNRLHWFRLFKFLPRAGEIFQINNINPIN